MQEGRMMKSIYLMKIPFSRNLDPPATPPKSLGLTVFSCEGKSQSRSLGLSLSLSLSEASLSLSSLGLCLSVSLSLPLSSRSHQSAPKTHPNRGPERARDKKAIPARRGGARQ